MVMILWQTVRKLDSPFASWRDLWVLAWGILVFTVSHFLVPRSIRFYRQAKFLHETTYVGEWLKPEPDIPPEGLRKDERLCRAESLYLEAVQIQKRLSEKSETDGSHIQHQQNVAITDLQLALLYLQQRHIEKASSRAEEAIEIFETLNARFPKNHEILSTLSDAFFRAAEVEQVRGRPNEAIAKYERSLAIDMSLKREAGVNVTVSRLRELRGLTSEPETTR